MYVHHMIRYVNICVYSNKTQSYEDSQALRIAERRLCIVLRRQRVFSVDQAGEQGFARDICHKQGYCMFQLPKWLCSMRVHSLHLDV
jgi:hypothetical protein